MMMYFVQENKNNKFSDKLYIFFIYAVFHSWHIIKSNIVEIQCKKIIV